MKILNYFIATSFLLLNNSFSQNVGINGTGGTAHPSALLDIDAVATPSLGVLIPRIALQAINISAPVSSPATSLLLYNTATASSGTNAVTPGYYYWDGVKWVRFANNASGSSSNAWDLVGNSGTNSSLNFVGTTDNRDLVFRTNNIERMRILNNGQIGVGISTTNSLFNISGSNGNSVSSSNCLFKALDATKNTMLYIDEGDNLSPNFSTSIRIGAYHHTSAGASSVLELQAGYSASQLVLLDGGNVGIGTPTPATRCDINGVTRSTFNGGAFQLVGANHVYNAYYPLGISAGRKAFVGFGNIGNADFFIANERTLGGIRFHTNSLNSLSNFSTPPFYIADAGNVGIGTNAPANKLEIIHGALGNSGLRLTNLPNASVLSTNANGDVIQATASTATNNAVYWGLLGNASTNPTTNFLGTTDVQDLAFRTNNIEAVRITNSGKVGIGTSTPTWQLDVISPVTTNIRVEGQSADLTNATIELRAKGTTNLRGVGTIMTDVNANNSWYAGRPYSGGLSTNDLFVINRKNAPTQMNEAAAIVNGSSLATGTQNFFTVRNNGNVGINTITPTEKLEVQGSVKIVDGTEGAGKVLVSDATGKGSWQSITNTVVQGVSTTSANTYPFVMTPSNSFPFMSFNLTPGVWEIKYGIGLMSTSTACDFYDASPLISVLGAASTIGTTQSVGFISSPGQFYPLYNSRVINVTANCIITLRLITDQTLNINSGLQGVDFDQSGYAIKLH